MTTGERNLLQAQWIIAELRRHGVTRFVVCPGSRSSALALALSIDDRAECVVHHDERGAGYYAVGYARATGRATAVITTSGTAAVNLFPSIIEASQDNLPLIALTADRPPELHGKGANQTIDQTYLYGNYVRFFADLPCPDDSDPDDAVRIVGEACDQARSGPVHINCRYREPLVPSPERVQPLSLPNLNEIVESTAAEPEPSVLDNTALSLRKATCGLLLVGHLNSEREQQAVLELIARLGWPVIADITSGLSAAQQPLIVNHHDLILASERFFRYHCPDAILHVGGRLTSKLLLQFIGKARPASYWFNAGHDIVYDPVGAVTKRTCYDTAIFCQRLGERIGGAAPSQVWNDTWRVASESSRKIVGAQCGRDDDLTEPSLAFSLARDLHGGTGLFLASSMPIRDMNMFATLGRKLPVASNRGASGIDGTIASACGYADGLNRRVTLLIGDQAFLHDLSSLTLPHVVSQPVTVVVVNNRGGRIFESLPVSTHNKMLDKFFVNRHDLTFEKIVVAFGMPHVQVGDAKAFSTAYEKMAVSGGSSIIEAAVDPISSREHRNRIVAEVSAAVDALKS